MYFSKNKLKISKKSSYEGHLSQMLETVLNSSKSEEVLDAADKLNKLSRDVQHRQVLFFLDFDSSSLSELSTLGFLKKFAFPLTSRVLRISTEYTETKNSLDSKL